MGIPLPKVSPQGEAPKRPSISMPANTGVPRTPTPSFTPGAPRPELINRETMERVLKHPDFPKFCVEEGQSRRLREEFLKYEVPERSLANMGGRYYYLLRVRLQGHSISGLISLAHPTKFTQKQLDDMLAEACKICNDVRMKTRRQEIMDKNIPFELAMNERFFDSDVEFVESVMIDKWQFLRVHLLTGENEIEPTAKIAPAN